MAANDEYDDDYNTCEEMHMVGPMTKTKEL